METIILPFIPRKRARPKRSGYVGVVCNGTVVGSTELEPDIIARRHEYFVPNTHHPRFRFTTDRSAILWNSFPATEEDMILAENWLCKKGVKPLIHSCAYVYDERIPCFCA